MALLEVGPEKTLIFPSAPVKVCADSKSAACMVLRNITNDCVVYRVITGRLMIGALLGIIPPNSTAEVRFIYERMKHRLKYERYSLVVQAIKSDATGEKQDAQALWARADRKLMEELRPRRTLSSEELVEKNRATGESAIPKELHDYDFDDDGIEEDSRWWPYRVFSFLFNLFIIQPLLLLCHIFIVTPWSKFTYWTSITTKTLCIVFICYRLNMFRSYY